MHLLLLAAGALLGTAGPRRRHAVLVALAALVPLLAFFATLGFARFSILLAALLFPAGSFATIVVSRTWPRVPLIFFLLLAPPIGGLPVGDLPRWLLVALAVAYVAAAAVLARFPDLGMRVACAFAGARLVAAGMSGAVPVWQKVAIAAALFAVATLWRRTEEGRLSRRAGLVAGGVMALALAAAVLAPLALAPTAPASARTTALLAVAPRGGLVWSLPSESILWDEPVDRAQFPRLLNLDAAWLGAPAALVVKLPGTTLIGLFSTHSTIAALREIKDPGELESMRLAARAVVEGLRDSLKLARDGATEDSVAQALMEAARSHGCSGPSFPPIVTSGPRAAQAHGTGNDGSLRTGELVVIDIGCYARGYASDFTRTLPVGGKFSERQRKLYDAVYEAQQAALRVCKPGARLQGRSNPNSIDGAARAAIKARGLEDHNTFGIGHTVGLFVHDVGPTTALRPGMVLTIEPGIYLKEELGIRIEDTYVVTKDGCELLTAGFPADAASVEAMLR